MPDEEEEFMPSSPSPSRPSSPSYVKPPPPSPETVRYHYEINLVTYIDNLIIALEKLNIEQILTGFYLEKFRIELTHPTAIDFFNKVLKAHKLYDTLYKYNEDNKDEKVKTEGGRRNKKRSTRRKKMRGKKTRKYKY